MICCQSYCITFRAGTTILTLIMSSTHEISDDDDSFCVHKQSNTITISSEDVDTSVLTEENITSDEDSELPKIDLKSSKSGVIKKLFESTNVKKNDQYKPKRAPYMFKVEPRRNNIYRPSSSKENMTSKNTSVSTPIQPQGPGFDEMIGGIKVNLPVKPYGCQIALMYKVITAIRKGQNCLLESPTGTGKTLALLCSALAWQRSERNRVGQSYTEELFTNFPELNAMKGAAEYIGSPSKFTEDKLFSRTVFGEKSIYDKPNEAQKCLQDDNACKSDMDSTCYGTKRAEPLRDSSQDSPDNLVNIHPKRQRLDAGEVTDSPTWTPTKVTPKTTPTKQGEPAQAETPSPVRNLYTLVESLHLRTGTLVDCSTPTIYYGARTHKQIQQVIKEFKRTSYCGEAKMSILSSREYSCIREFDRAQWSTKNDMCRGCIKMSSKNEESNCKYYENRLALNHQSLPPAFDLEDLVAAGHENTACPYFGARAMATNAHIVFCPYNYLIEPTIRNSMQIDLRGNIVIIDEAHNIEDICRDAASVSFTRDHILSAIMEVEKVADSRYANADLQTYIDKVLKALKDWDYWFVNQSQLLANKAVNRNEAVHTWQPEHFLQTLDNHNIGMKQYPDFKISAEIFCQRLREDPRMLLGVTQATVSLIESIDLVLGYMFRCEGKYKDDFTPALVRTVTMETSYDAGLWRRSNFTKKIEKDVLELRLMCMNPAVVFESLKVAKCIILASGTLTPLVSLYSELGTDFPLKVSPGHVIPKERIWVGTLVTCPNGQPLQCKSNDTAQPGVQDALGETILWVCRVTPHGVLCFVPSYRLMDLLVDRWQENGTWSKLEQLKHVFVESRNVKDHEDVMGDYYKYVESDKGAILFAVFRGKVSEGMDFKDHQARAVITIGIPYPNMFDMAVQAKVNYNEKYCKSRGLLPKSEWLLVQAYRALNQAVGRCVRHRGDWGAVLLVDSRFQNPYYTQHLSGWVKQLLNDNHHSFDSLVNSANSLESFMQNMTLTELEDV